MTSIFFTRTCHIVKRFGQTIQEGKVKGRLTSLTSRSRLVIDETWSVAHCRHLQGICFAHQTSRKPAVPYEHAQLSKIQIISIRHKKKKASSSPVEDGDDSDGSEDDDEQGNDFKVLKGNVNSTRIDSVLKFALGMSRNKVENAFYSNSIYLNGERLDKKKHSVTIEDEVDVVRGLNTLNPSFIDVHRVEVLDIQRSRTDPDKLVIKVKRFKRLTIDNYARPWKPPASE